MVFEFLLINPLIEYNLVMNFQILGLWKGYGNWECKFVTFPTYFYSNEVSMSCVLAWNGQRWEKKYVISFLNI